MSLSNAAETSILGLIFNATAWANYADNASSSPQTNIAVSLHTADPGEAGTMATNETAYTSYARAAVARSGSGWTVSTNTVVPAANIDFATGSGGADTVTHFATGKTGGGAAPILVSGTVTPSIVTGNGVTPRLNTSTQIVAD